MMFIAIFTIIFTVFVLFLNISHLYALLPVDYGKMVSIRSSVTKCDVCDTLFFIANCCIPTVDCGVCGGLHTRVSNAQQRQPDEQ